MNLHIAFFAASLSMITLATSLCADSTTGEPGVSFDMDESKEGLNYLNYSDDYVTKTGPGGADLSGLGGGTRASAGQGRSDSDHPKILLPAVFAARAADVGTTYFLAGLLSPLLAGGSADHFDKPDKFLSNRPIGRRDGSGGHNMNRNLGSVTLEEFDPGGGRPQQTIENKVARHSAGSTPVRTDELTLFSMPKIDMSIDAYETDLPEKQATNRPIGRSGGGRGNNRQLYPAHPDSP